MMIKAEIFEGSVLLLDDTGRVWQIAIDYAHGGPEGEPTMQILERVPRETVNRLMRPSLARYVG